MKIIHIIAGKADPNTLNGVNKVVHSLAEEQYVLGHDITIYGVANNTLIRHKYNYKLVLFKKNKFPFLPPLDFIKVINKEEKGVVIHIHSAFIKWYPYLMAYLRIKGFRELFVTPHGAYTNVNLKKSLLKLVYFLLLESFVIMLSKKVHVIGKSEINNISKIFIKDKFILIPNGCSINSFCQNIVTSQLTFGYMGRFIITHKGLDLLLEGFSLYRQEGGNGELLMVGDGIDKNRLLSYVKEKKIEKTVHFLGIKHGKDKVEYLKKLSFFVHTSRWEGFPTACLEAASFNIPLLVSTETNMGDLISKYNSGAVLSSNTTQNIKEALFSLEAVYKDKNTYKTLQLNVKKMIISELTWKIVSEKIINSLYN